MTSDPLVPEIVYTKATRTSCEGEGGALGHPRVFLQMGAEGYVDCGYCDRRFILEGGPADTRGNA
ncbi:MAG: zinc-finger domain-containing protein [Pseudomonadota bacterium]